MAGRCAQREVCAGRCAHRGADADGRGTDLDGLDGILDLEEAALRREGVHAAVVLASGEEHLSVHARAAGCGQREGQREGQGRAGHRELPPLSALQLHVRAGGPLLSRWGRAGRRDCRSVAPSLTQLAALRPSLSCAALQTSPLCCLSLTRWPLRLHAASAAHRLAAPWHWWGLRGEEACAPSPSDADSEGAHRRLWEENVTTSIREAAWLLSSSFGNFAIRLLSTIGENADSPCPRFSA